jgi:hypothetical protein
MAGFVPVECRHSHWRGEGDLIRRRGTPRFAALIMGLARNEKKGRSAPSLACDRPFHGQRPCRTTCPFRQDEKPLNVLFQGRLSGNRPCFLIHLTVVVVNDLSSGPRSLPSIIVIDLTANPWPGRKIITQRRTVFARRLSAQSERRKISVRRFRG